MARLPTAEEKERIRKGPRYKGGKGLPIHKEGPAPTPTPTPKPLGVTRDLGPGVIDDRPTEVTPTGTPGGPPMAPAPPKGGYDRKATPQEIMEFEKKYSSYKYPRHERPQVAMGKLPASPGLVDREEVRPDPKVTKMPGPRGYINEKGVFIPTPEVGKAGKLVSFMTQAGPVSFRTRPKMPKLPRRTGLGRGKSLRITPKTPRLRR